MAYLSRYLENFWRSQSKLQEWGGFIMQSLKQRLTFLFYMNKKTFVANCGN